MAARIIEVMLKVCSKSPLLNSRWHHQSHRCINRLCVNHLIVNQQHVFLSTATASHQTVGETVEDRVQDPAQVSLQHHDYFDLQSVVSLQDLFSSRVHLGHKTGSRNVYMSPYIFGCRQDVDIIDLDQTLKRLQDAMNFTAHIAYRRGIILFLSRHNQMLPLVEKTAEECGEFSHCRYWKGGTFTNSAIQFQAETRLPDLCIFINTLNNAFLEHRAMIEANKLLIPVVGIVDTNCDPRLVTYPVPGNDDTPSAISLYCRLFKEAIIRGKAKRKEDGM